MRSKSGERGPERIREGIHAARGVEVSNQVSQISAASHNGALIRIVRPANRKKTRRWPCQLFPPVAQNDLLHLQIRRNGFFLKKKLTSRETHQRACELHEPQTNEILLKRSHFLLPFMHTQVRKQMYAPLWVHPFHITMHVKLRRKKARKKAGAA